MTLKMTLAVVMMALVPQQSPEVSVPPKQKHLINWPDWYTPGSVSQAWIDAVNDGFKAGAKP